MAAKVVDAADGGTVTDAGTVSAGLVFVSVTAAPFEGAGLFSEIVQLLEAFAPTVDGLQTREETSTGASKLMTVLAELLPYVAVIQALPLYRNPPVVTFRPTDAVAAATVTDAGTTNPEFELDNVTTTPPTGAGLFIATVQWPEALGPRLESQNTADTWMEETRLTVVFAELPL